MLIYVTGNTGSVEYTAALVRNLGVFPVRGFPSNLPDSEFNPGEAELCRRVDAVLWLGAKFNAATNPLPAKFQGVTMLYDLDEVRDWIQAQRRAAVDATQAGEAWANEQWAKFISDNPPHAEAGGWAEA